MFEEKIKALNQSDIVIEAAKDEAMKKVVYTPEEIQNILGISKPTVYKLLKQHPFHVLKIGHCLRISKTEFDHWLQG